MSRILIAEDEPQLASFLEKGLRAAGYTTTVCGDGLSAADKARDEDFDLLILDLALPGQDGFDVLRAVRRRAVRMPVLVLTASNRLQDTVAALDSGADDYLTKPFDFGELIARVRARVRSGEQERGSPQLGQTGLKLDARSRRASAGDVEVDLTEREFRLLELFLRRRGEVLSRDELLSEVWGRDAGGASNNVDVYISGLRRKLGAERIETIRGRGYRIPAG